MSTQVCSKTRVGLCHTLQMPGSQELKEWANAAAMSYVATQALKHSIQGAEKRRKEEATFR